MFREINLLRIDGTESSVPFLCTGTTAIRFKSVFKKELLGAITSIISAAGADELVGLMKATAEKEKEQQESEEPQELDLEDLDAGTLQVIIKIAGSGELDSISKMAFIMNMQANHEDMTKLDMEKYINWLDQFETMEFLTHAMDFIALYMSGRTPTSTPKKSSAQLTEK